MNYEIIFISSFIYGFSSSFHCITMCGPFVGMLNIIGESKLTTNVIYNLGRFTSYTLIGSLMGFLGFSLNLSSEVTKIQNISIILSTIFILATGIALIFNKKLIPDSGANKIIKKLFHPFMEAMRKSTHTLLFSFIFGMFTGLLPCTILYPAFAMSLATGNPMLGGISMSSFFLGTLPGLLLFGLGFHKIKSYVLKDYAALVGIGIITVGLSTVFLRMNHNHANHHHMGGSSLNQESDKEVDKAEETESQHHH
ncbi:MAG TPA: sulfite exporter TauE/SafE family protein, partial [Leptospiraceae bacterium]|nr:sulfite exporter TauE/SafE family protein [Leptospiraceae bacterium]